MKKFWVIIGLIAFSYNSITCQEPVIEMKTFTYISFDFSFEIAAIVDNTPIQVDFGNGVPVSLIIHSYTTWIIGTVGESQIIKIYGSGVTYLNCSGKRWPEKHPRRYSREKGELI